MSVVGIQEQQNFLQAMSAVTNTYEILPKDGFKFFCDVIVTLEVILITSVQNFDVSEMQNQKLNLSS